MLKNGHNKYLQTKIMTASKEQLVLMLYDGVLRFCSVAKSAWLENDIEKAHNALLKAQNIILELAFSLDKEQGGQIADRLASLYSYAYTRLVSANIEHSEEIVNEVITIVEDLRDAWQQIMPQMATAVNNDAGNKTTDPQPQGSKVIAKIPVARIPATEAKDGSAEDRPSLSIQG